MSDATSNPGQRPDDTPQQPTPQTRNSRDLNRGIDRNPGTDLHGGQRPCPVYAWCDIKHERVADDYCQDRHDVVANAARALFLDGGLALPVRLVDPFDDGDLEIHLDLEHSVADDLSDLRTLATVPLELPQARELAHRLDRIHAGETTHRDDAPIWLTRGNVALAVQRDEAWDRRHQVRATAAADVVHLQVADDYGRTLIDLPIPLDDVAGLVANLAQLLGYAALSHNQQPGAGR